MQMNETTSLPQPATAASCSRLLLATVPRLMRTLGASARQLRGADEEPISMGQIRMLDVLDAQSWRLSDLAARHHVTPSTMSRTVDVLVRRGWVARLPDPADRRQVMLSLTDDGRAALAEFKERTQAIVAAMMSRLDGDALARLYDGLDVLQGLLDAEIACEVQS